MRRFSTVAAAAILLFTATGFADDTDNDYYQKCSTEGQSNFLPLMGLSCVSCGVQIYNTERGRNLPNPSEKWLATLASAARSFRELNAGEPGAKSNSTVINGIAKVNMQKVVISQIQAYGYCTRQSRVQWPVISKFITNKYDQNKENKTELAKILGFKKGFWSSSPAYDNFKSLLDDSAYTTSTLAAKRANFNAAADNLLTAKDVDDDLRDCLNEMKSNRVNLDKSSDLQSYQLCHSMAKACDITEADFCATNGMPLSVKTGGGGSGSSSQGSGGSQQNPRPPIPASSKQPSGGKKLPPPPVQ